MKKSVNLTGALRSYMLPEGLPFAKVKEAIVGLSPQDKVDLALGLYSLGALNEAGYQDTLEKTGCTPDPTYEVKS